MYQRQVSFSEAISMAFNKYCCFSGRASRSEYWWFYLFTLILSFACNMVPFLTDNDYSMAVTGLSGVVSLALFLPSLGLAVRRLHDIGKGGGWIFINLIPLVGQIIYIVWMCRNSEPFDNRFGPVPNIVE